MRAVVRAVIRTESTWRCAAAAVSNTASRVGCRVCASPPRPDRNAEQAGESPTAAASPASRPPPPAFPSSRSHPQFHLAVPRPHRVGQESKQNWCHHPPPRTLAPVPPYRPTTRAHALLRLPNHHQLHRLPLPHPLAQAFRTSLLATCLGPRRHGRRGAPEERAPVAGCGQGWGRGRGGQGG